MLSGGERNRLMLARLFLKPANLLIMDEPTNDLDLETLDLLRDTLLNYQGTLIIVSHDRDFLDSVVTSLWSFDEDGGLREYVGGYSDWLRQKPSAPTSTKLVETTAAPNKPREPIQNSTRKLSYNEQREYKQLEDTMAALEHDIEALEQAMATPEFFTQDPAEVARETTRYQDLKERLDAAFLRFMELDEHFT